MKVLLIMPPLLRLIGVRFSYFPIGLGYLAACLKKDGISVYIYNAENPSRTEELHRTSNLNMLKQYDNYLYSINDDNHIIWQEIKQVVEDISPDIIGLSVSTAKIASALKISLLCKEVKRDSSVVWGGPHPTIQPDEVLHNQAVDFVIRGEGENTFVELIRQLGKDESDFTQIEGLSYRQNNRIIHNQVRPLIGNLDELPFPAKDCVLFPERYFPWDMGVMVSSRGCPFNCAFCGAGNIWGRSARQRTIDNIIQEIKYTVKRFRTKQIFFWDDTLNLNRQRLIDLCLRLIQEKIGITWRCTARLNLLDRELLKIMRKSGCNSMDVGIESGSEKILKAINKELTLKQIITGIKLIRKSGINFNAFFMIGFPDETEEDIRQTFDLMKRKEMGNIILSIFTPYPGTQLYARARELGLIPDLIDWSLFSHHSPHNHFVRNISRDRFKVIVKDIASYVDKHNNSLGVFLKIHKNEVRFYLRNPLIFLQKLSEKLRTLFGNK